MSRADTRACTSQDDIVQSVIDWRVRLSDGDPSPEDQRAFERWLADSPAHREAWERLGRGLRKSVGGIEPLLIDRRSSLLRQALIKPSVGRRQFMGKAFGLCTVGVGAAWLLDQQVPLRNLAADLGTGTAERAGFVLPDGSRMALDARSRVDLDFSGDYRQVRLLAGAVDIQAVSDESRPFLVRTDHGSIQAIAAPAVQASADAPPPGSYFMVRQDAHGTLLVVRRQRVLARNLAGVEQYVDGGKGLSFDAASMAAPDPRLSTHAAWTDGYLEVHDRSLGEVIAALDAYFPGVLRLSPEAAVLRVSGSFPLDAPDRALQALAQTLPIRVRHYTRWVVTIDMAPRQRRA